MGWIMPQKVCWEVCLIWMMSKKKEYHSMTDCLTKRCDVIHKHCICKTVFFLGKNRHTKFLRSQPSLWSKKQFDWGLLFVVHKAEEAGAWGCQIPNKFLPVYIQGGTCSTLCDVSGAHADFGRHASAEKEFLGDSDAHAWVRFLMGNVISRFSVRQVYDTFLYNRRANYNEPQPTSERYIHELCECIRERP